MIAHKKTGKTGKKTAEIGETASRNDDDRCKPGKSENLTSNGCWDAH